MSWYKKVSRKWEKGVWRNYALGPGERGGRGGSLWMMEKVRHSISLENSSNKRMSQSMLIVQAPALFDLLQLISRQSRGGGENVLPRSEA